jgi:hypothetical protein
MKTLVHKVAARYELKKQLDTYARLMKKLVAKLRVQGADFQPYKGYQEILGFRFNPLASGDEPEFVLYNAKGQVGVARANGTMVFPRSTYSSDPALLEKEALRMGISWLKDQIGILSHRILEEKTMDDQKEKWEEALF